jgi:dCTP deaminase
MFLSDVDIKRAVKDGSIILKPFEQSRLQPASYDILLGNKFVVNDGSATHFVDPSRKIFTKTKQIKVIDGGEYIHHPGLTVLGVSKEFFGSEDYQIQV